MATLPITIATWDYDRVRPIIDGRVAVAGCAVAYRPMAPSAVFARAWGKGEFEVAELGVGSYMIALSRGLSNYVAIPVFLSRLFRHSSIYIRSDRGIATPQDLNGRTIGVLQYQNAAGLWARGMLKEDYGFLAESCDWRQGGLNEPQEEKMPMNLPPGFRLTPIDGPLNQWFEEGRVDAVISPEAPRAYGDGKTPVRRLFEDFTAAEQAYYRRTGIFPIMHVLAVRRDVLAAHPWLAQSLYDAFCAAKAVSQEELFETAALKVGLPWLLGAAQESRAIFGGDFWPYGIAANRRTLDAMVRYSVEQGQATRLLPLDELFAAVEDHPLASAAAPPADAGARDRS